MTCRGFEQVCTADEARDYFKAKGLTYGDITEGDILVLTMLLQRELKKSNKAKETSADMTLSSQVDMKQRDDGTFISCFFRMNSHYFDRREAISFNRDGFIGFAGWADVGNKNPLLRAFLAWCDYLTNEPQGDGWLSVKDQLPPEDGAYIVCTETGAVCTSHYYKSHQHFSGRNRRVTHWRPMPEPPKEARHGR